MPSNPGNVNADVTLRTPGRTQIDLGLDDVGLKLSGAEPIALVTRSELAVTEPLDVNANINAAATVDIKPLVFDLRLSLGKVVPAYIRLPYRHHFGIRLFGFELFGFTLHGEQQISILDTAPRAVIRLHRQHAPTPWRRA